MNEVIIRSLSGMAYIILMLGSLYLPPIYLHILFSIFVLVSALEMFAMNIRTEVDVPLWWALLPITFFLSLGVPQMGVEFGLALSMLILFFVMIHTLLQEEISSFTMVGRLLLITVYVGVPFISALRLNSYETSGLPLLASIYILVWTNDTMAYVFGKWLGATPLAPTISPGKTIEGLVGGFLSTLTVGLIFYYFQRDFGVLIWITLAICATSLGTLGDLFESKLKREAQIKDSGYVFPGHGGLLDRLDSLLFVLPACYFIFSLFVTN